MEMDFVCQDNYDEELPGWLHNQGEDDNEKATLRTVGTDLPSEGWRFVP
jgi:hypothetical protein